MVWKRIPIFLHVFIVSIFLYIIAEGKRAPTDTQFTVVQAHWGGYNVNCTDDCTKYGSNIIQTDGSVACSGGRGTWNGGKQTFFDPVPQPSPMNPQSYVVTQVEVFVVGRFNCAGLSTGVALNVTLQGEMINEGTAATIPSGCDCLYCMNILHLVSPIYLSGWPGYNYAGVNGIDVLWDQTSEICLDYVNITLYYIEVFPNVITLYPSAGPTTGSTLISIWGGSPGYVPNITYCCVFGEDGTAVQATFVDVQHVTCVVPPAVAGVYEVYIKVLQNGYSMDTGLSFRYYPPPSLDQISPSSALSGDSVYVIGNNFTNLPSSRITWGSQIINAVYLNSTHLNVTVPTGSGNIQVNFSQNGQQYTNSVEFAYRSIPSPSPSPKNSLFPGWVWVVFIFGGLTILIVAVLVLSRRFTSHERDPSETTSLLSTNDSLFIKQIDITSVKILHRIGKGTFGEVFKGVWNGTEVAIKFLNAPTVVNDQFLSDFNKEVTIMRGCRHPNVLQFMGASTNPPNICIVMEYMPLGSLYKILHDESVKLELEMIRKMMLDAARGMNYLHKSNPVIIHRDLKSHNLLVDENWKVKVCDFGLSKIMENTSDNNNMTACGTPSWTAPEILRNEKYTEKADVYSFGIVLWECMTRLDPYEGMPPFQVVLNVGTKAMRPPLPTCPKAWQTLVTDCWDETPESRPSFDEIILRLEQMAPQL